MAPTAQSSMQIGEAMDHVDDHESDLVDELVDGASPIVNQKRTISSDDITAFIADNSARGLTPKWIIQQLKERFDVTITPQAVHARNHRATRFRDERRDQELDLQCQDWHIGDDAALESSLQEAQPEFTERHRVLEERKWCRVSDILTEKTGVRRYSAKECKSRYEALINGTALLPIELDADQEGRNEMRLERIAAAHKASEERKAYEEAERAQKETLSKIAKHAKATARERRLARQETAKELQEEREEQRLAENQKRADCQYQEAWYRSKRQAEDALIERLKQSLGQSKKRKAMRAPSTGFNKNTKIDGNESREVLVTKDTLANPRSIMALDKLDALIVSRGLPRRQSQESHALLIARLSRDHEAMAKGKLVDLLFGEYLDKRKGTKLELLRRLELLDAQNSRAGSAGVSAADGMFKETYEGYNSLDIETESENQ